MDLQSLKTLSNHFPLSEKMPVLFLGHGSPMNAIEENEFVQGFRQLSTTLPRPAAILCISAHWLTKGSFVTAMEKPVTIHDFGGFPEELYQVQYPAPGSPPLAYATKELVPSVTIGLDNSWGLDHGAWSVIKHLYPKADIPVIQLSIDYSKPASWHYELAKELGELRHRGILIIGSGNIIHNLRMADFKNMFRDNYGYDWAVEAHTLFNNLIMEGNDLALVDYLQLGKAAQLAIPTPDHYLPLIYTLGLKSHNDVVSLFNDKLLAGSLSMTSLKIA